MARVLNKNIMISKRKQYVASLACSLLWIASGASYGQDVIATTAKLSGDIHHTRFEAELSSAVGYSVFVLNKPYRVVIDMPSVSFDLPPGVGHKPKGLVTAFRYGIVEEGKSRIMIDTAGPVLITKSFITSAKGQKQAHLVVDIVETSEEAFAAAYAKDHPETETAAITPAAAPPPLQPEPTKEQKRMIVIDPGHGGIDPGASSAAKNREKDIVLAYGAELRNMLVKTGHYNVVMTRSDDTFVPLTVRVKTARDNKADLFIAIHADTLNNPTVRGTTIYTVSEKASDAEAEALAQKENRSDIIAGIDLGHQNDGVANILINLAQRESKNEAMYFSKKAAAEFKQVTEMTGQPIRSAAFVVLKAPDVPSVLVELGYLSSKQDEALLVSEAWRSKMAAALTNSIESYFKFDLAVGEN
jgi:N-acetylmuramoyl-L-alanine amidase